MWRAFVYQAESPDRACQAYEEFMPFDGQFRDNVIVQVKNGPIDFNPVNLSALVRCHATHTGYAGVPNNPGVFGAVHSYGIFGNDVERLFGCRTYRVGGGTVADVT